MTARRFATVSSVVAAVAALWLGWVALREEPAPTDPLGGTAGVAAAAVVPADAAAPASPGDRLPVDRGDAARDAPPTGFTGRVVDAAGVPLDGASVEVVEAAGEDVLAAALLAERGFELPPAGRITTGPDGRFRIGLRTPSPRGYELRAAHPRHPARVVGPLAAHPGRDHDLGDVALPPAAVLTGQVTVDGRPGLPVAGATVTVQPNAPTVGLTPTAWRRRPARVVTDAAGRYRLDGLPIGVVAVRVTADGFATRELPQVALEAAAPNRRDVTLLPGRSIDGRVTDAAGRPLAGAEVVARTIGDANPLEHGAVTAADGSYRVDGLGDGPHRLTATAPGHAAAARQPVASGARGEDFALAPLPALRVVVRTPDGAPATRYDLELRRADPREPDGRALLAAAGARLERVTPERLAADGEFVHPGVAPGVYVFEARAAGHAESFSEPFTVRGDEPPARVEVPLVRGAVCTVEVVDPDGNPAVGALVASLDPATPAWRSGTPSPLPKLAGRVSRISRRELTTGADGRARFDALAPGTYRFVARAPGCCDAIGAPVELTAATDGETAGTVLRLALEPGVPVGGSVEVDGAPAGQVHVSLVRVEPPAADGASLVFGEAISDADGRFAIPVPLPPGRYEARAERRMLSNPLERILDQKRSLQVIDLARSQGRHDLRFRLEGS